jgi:hypothetical protein
VTNLKKYQAETRAWRDPKVKLKQIQSWKSGAFAKPPHGEHRKIGSKVDMTIHGFRENEVTSDEKRGNPKKRQVTHSEDLR